MRVMTIGLLKVKTTVKQMISEELYDQDPDRLLFATEKETETFLKTSKP